MAYVKAIAYKDPEECDVLLKNVELNLLTHQIRGKNILSEVAPHKEIQVEVNYKDTFTNHEHFALPKYMEDVLNNKTEAIEGVDIKIIENPMNLNNDKLIRSSDELYVKEMQSLTVAEPSDTQKMYQVKHKTMKNSYHLVSSVMSVIESDSETDDVTWENEKCSGRVYTKSRTFFNKNAKFAEAHSQNPLIEDNSAKFFHHLRYCNPQNGCSRWSYLVLSLESMKDCQHFLGKTDLIK